MKFVTKNFPTWLDFYRTKNLLLNFVPTNTILSGVYKNITFPLKGHIYLNKPAAESVGGFKGLGNINPANIYLFKVNNRNFKKKVWNMFKVKHKLS